MTQPTTSDLTLTMEDLKRLAHDAQSQLERATKDGDQPNMMFWTGYMLCIRHIYEGEEE